MADMKTILIIVLVVFIWYSYNNPGKGNELIDNGLDKIKGFVPSDSDACTEQYDPVCADEVTYTNECQAGADGKTNITLGVCS